jgi:hypothetical protein
MPTCFPGSTDPICVEFYGGPSPQVAAATVLDFAQQGYSIMPAGGFNPSAVPPGTAVNISTAATETPWYYKFGMSPKLWGLTVLGALGAGLAYKKFKK